LLDGALAQIGIVEIHTWNSTDDDVERPSRIVWISSQATTFAKAGVRGEPLA